MHNLCITRFLFYFLRKPRRGIRGQILKKEAKKTELQPTVRCKGCLWQRMFGDLWREATRERSMCECASVCNCRILSKVQIPRVVRRDPTLYQPNPTPKWGYVTNTRPMDMWSRPHRHVQVCCGRVPTDMPGECTTYLLGPCAANLGIPIQHQRHAAYLRPLLDGSLAASRWPVRAKSRNANS